MDIQLLHGDCLELMQDIPDKSIDMILCDPPYGTTYNKWDSVIDIDRMWTEYKRIIKDNGAICLFGQPPFSSMLIMSNLKMFRYEWIWIKSMATGFLNANRMPLRATENVMVFYKKLPTYHPQKTPGEPYERRHGAEQTATYGQYRLDIPTVNTDGMRYPTNVLRYANGNHGSLHPTQKPVPLLEYLIKTYTDPGDTVLDNCMGSGSTGVACVNTDRNFIGIELDNDYYQIAQDRIGNVHIPGSN